MQLTKEQITITKWEADKNHCEINFKVKHLMITTITGRFNNYNFSAETEDNDFSSLKVIFTAETASLNTNNSNRDNHLKAEDFFNVEKYPELKFVSGRIEKKCDWLFDMHGDLTIRDITKPIKFELEFFGIAKDVDGNFKAGFRVEGKINRKDFGLSFSALNEDGIFLVGNEVDLHAEIQLIKIL
ncbi:MAG: YceI family protein [Bacteroidia bacterium]|nr:YceI family protein [Bacteroidia bacterium]